MAGPVASGTDSLGPSPSPSGVSLTALANVEHYLQVVREDIVAAFVKEQPRLEMALFTAMTGLFEEKILPYIQIKTNRRRTREMELVPEDEQALVEGKYVVEYAMQDLFASLLFLLSEESIETEAGFSVAAPPSTAASRRSNPSEFFVSLSQRRLCAQILFFLCWCPALPLECIISSLYPLLAVSGDHRLLTRRNDYDGRSALENHLAANLFEASRFSWKKKLVAETLTGLIFSRPHGVRCLYNVFILSDRMAVDSSLKEATECIHKLLVSEAGTVWMRRTEGQEVVSRGPLAPEDQFATLCSELVELTEAHAQVGEREKGGASASWRRVKPSGSSNSEPLPRETLEDRLHQSLVLLLNQLLFIPHKSDKSFQQHYRHYYYTNRFFLTPAFGALTLRSSASDLNLVVRAVERLRTIAHGVQLGAAPLCFSTILEVVMPGLLQLMALRHEMPQCLQTPLNAFWQILHREGLKVNLVAEIIARSCFCNTKYHFLLVNRVEPELRVALSPCPGGTLLDGLCEAVFFFEEAVSGRQSSLLRSKTLCALALHCRSDPAAMNSEASVRIRLAVQFLERYLVAAPAECIFGASTSLIHVFNLMNLLVPLSPTCCHWAVTLAAQMLKEVSAEAVEQQQGLTLPQRLEEKRTLRLVLIKFKLLALQHADSSAAAEERSCSGLDRLLSVLDSVCDLLDKKSPEGGSVDSGTPEMAAVEQLRDAYGSVRQALAGGSVAALSVELSRLASVAEQLSLAALSHDAVRMIQKTLSRHLLQTLSEILEATPDTFSAVSCIKTLCWMGMYRWDAADSSGLAALLYDALRQTAPLSVVPLGPAKVSPSEQRGIFKVRLLDLILSWCDYDHQGRTLRNVDDFGTREHGMSLFQLLTSLCQAKEQDIVQVAALNCIGNYVPAVYPRVSLWQLSQLCIDVFRHTPIEMSKAACASMLLHAVHALTNSSRREAFAMDAELRDIHHVAHAMSNYYAASPTTEPTLDHSAVVRQHGSDLLSLLSSLVPREILECK